MNWRIGDTFRARDTGDVRDCSILPGTPGRIEGMIGGQISFYLEKSGPKQGYATGHASLGDFNHNFAWDKGKESKRREKETSNLYANSFPSDWRRPSGRPA